MRLSNLWELMPGPPKLSSFTSSRQGRKLPIFLNKKNSMGECIVSNFSGRPEHRQSGPREKPTMNPGRSREHGGHSSACSNNRWKMIGELSACSVLGTVLSSPLRFIPYCRLTCLPRPQMYVGFLTPRVLECCRCGWSWSHWIMT